MRFRPFSFPIIYRNARREVLSCLKLGVGWEAVAKTTRSCNSPYNLCTLCILCNILCLFNFFILFYFYLFNSFFSLVVRYLLFPFFLVFFYFFIFPPVLPASCSTYPPAYHSRPRAQQQLVSARLPPTINYLWPEKNI